MEPSNNDQLINNASVNDNRVILCLSPYMPNTDCTNLDTFDFESFLTVPESDPLISGDYATIRDIDFAAESHTYIDEANYSNYLPPENPGAPKPLHNSLLTGHSPAIDDTLTLPPYVSLGDIFIADPLYPNVFMDSHQASPNNWRYTWPHQLKVDYNNFGQHKRPRQVLGDVHDREEDPAQSPSLPTMISKAAPKSKRSLNIAKFDPSLFYKTLAKQPTSWSPPQSIDTTFKYNAQGELDPRCSFSREQILDYLTYHPLHTLYGPSPSTKHSGLKLLIQTTPADARNRYPTPLSSKCRFACCPAPNRTIRNGQFRVAFDEQSIFGEPLDPFHNAGYVHLFCLEQNFDFPLMCRRFNVQGDDREFPEGRNRMAITRDYPSMLDIVDGFIRSSLPFGGNKLENWYDQSLSLALTRHHLQHQCKLRQRVREARRGNSIDRHLNNLDVMVELGRDIRQRKSEENKPRASRKRKTSG